MEDLLRTTAQVLGSKKLPTEALPVIWETMRKNKEGIDKMLGLNDRNLYRVALPLERSEEDVRKEYPQTYAVVAHLLDQARQAGSAIDLGTLSLVNNSVTVKGQAGKVSKIVSKQLKGQEALIDYCKAELKIAKPEQFLPKLGDIVKSGRKLFISTNLLDFLTSSENASFTSCHGMTGCHFNGNLAYARDNMTVITFIGADKATEKDHQIYKLGRSWLFLPGLDCIVQPKSYGAYFDFEREAARLFLEQKIAQNLGIANSFTRKGGVTYNTDEYSFESPKDSSSGAGALYFDNYAIDLSVPVGKDLKKKNPKLEFAAAMCLVCAETTDHQTKGVCSMHNGKVTVLCSVCGTRHAVERIHTHNDQHYCGTCFAARFKQCRHCGQYHPSDEVEAIDGNYVCKSCKAKHYSTCDCCKSFGKSDKFKDMKGIGKVCAKCSDKFLLCSVCGNYHLADKVTYHKYVGRVCESCTEAIAVRCDDCGEFHKKENIKAGSGVTLCVKCDAKSRGEELELSAMPKYAGLPKGWDDFIEIVG